MNMTGVIRIGGTGRKAFTIPTFTENEVSSSLDPKLPLTSWHVAEEDGGALQALKRRGNGAAAVVASLG